MRVGLWMPPISGWPWGPAPRVVHASAWG
jgi:hypothetical protein